MTTEPNRPRRRWRRRLAVLAVVLLAVAAVPAYLWWRAASQLRSVLAELDEFDPGWRWDTMQVARPAVAPGENAAVLALEIGQALPGGYPGPRRGPGGDQPDLYTDLLGLPPPNLLPPSQARDLAAELEPYQHLLARVPRLADRPRGRLPVAYDPLRPTDPTYLEQFDRLRAAQHLLSLDLLHRLQADDAAGAATTARGQFALGRAVGLEPALVGYVNRVVLETAAVADLERLLARAQPDEATLARLHAAVAAARQPPILAYALRGERAAQHEWLDALAQDRVPLGGGKTFLDGLERATARYHLLASHPQTLELLTDQIAAAESPSPASEARLARRDRDHGPPTLVPTGRPFAGLAGAGFQKLRLNERRRVAALVTAEAALAAERHRLHHGRWPAEIADLVPAFLAALPLDPFLTNQPLQMARTDEGLVVYSVGPNGKDDGGQVTPLGTAPNTVPLDLGFRLWDPARRRQPPVKPDSAGPAADSGGSRDSTPPPR